MTRERGSMSTGGWFAHLLLCLSLSIPGSVSMAAPSSPVPGWIVDAGNAEEDRDRLAILKRLRETPGLDGR